MDKIVKEVIERSATKLSYTKGSPFTKEGYDTLKVEISTYINDIISEAFKIAKRNKSDLISKSHIESASFNLIRKNSNENNQILSSIGGFLFGFSISKILEIISDSEKLTKINIIIISASGIIGAFLLGITLLRPRD